MRIALIQERQNALYDFHACSLSQTVDEARAMQLEMVDANLSLLRQAGKAGADLAITSEAINYPGQPRAIGSVSKQLVGESQQLIIDRVSDVARSYAMNVIVGMLTVRHNVLRNSALAFNRSGMVKCVYDKVFLAGNEKNYMESGKAFHIWKSDLGPIGIAICWDMQFPEVARLYALNGAELVACPSWGWERTYAAARAYENGIYTASAMAVPFDKAIQGMRSPSQVIAPDATILAEGPKDRESLVIAEVDCLQKEVSNHRQRLDDCLVWLSAFGIDNDWRKVPLTVDE